MSSIKRHARIVIPSVFVVGLFVSALNFIRIGGVSSNDYYTPSLFFLYLIFPFFGFLLQWLAERNKSSGKKILLFFSPYCLYRYSYYFIGTPH